MRRVCFLELRIGQGAFCELRLTSGSVKLHSWVTTPGKQGTEAEPGPLGVFSLIRQP
jgi:hypothetical protein